ncbi:MAG: mechanosensitive ion channel family protein [Nitratireductor sp.]|nr:mechanosensitive ion channel family protein [Nitratireductor sp.]
MMKKRAISGVVLLLLLLAGVIPSLAQEGGDSPKPRSGLASERILADSMVATVANEDTKDPETGLPVAALNPDIDPQELDFRLVPLTEEELSALASKWLSIVKKKTEEVMAAQISIYKTQENVEEAARQKLTELNQERRTLFSKFARVVASWENKGGDPDTIKKYRLYQAAIIVEETRSADAKTLLAQLRAWLTDRDGGVEIGIDLVVIIASLLGLLVAARLFRGVFGHWLLRFPDLSKLLQAFLVTTVYWLIIVIGLLIVLSALGIDVSPLFALIGGASFILAFAFQDTLGNLASGMMIMVNRPFDQGDYVDIGGTSGTVKSVSIVTTTVVTPDNQVIVIPNKNVWGNVITNVTASDTRRVDLVFGISYDDSIPEAAQLIEKVVKEHPLVLDDPAPMIRVNELAGSSVNFICRPWANTEDYWVVYWDLMQQVKERFDEAGITIPYPQQDIHVRNYHHEPPGKRRSAAVKSPTKSDRKTGARATARSKKAKAQAAAMGDGGS